METFSENDYYRYLSDDNYDLNPAELDDYDENEITSILSCMVTDPSNEGIQKLNKSFYMIQTKKENIFQALTPPVTSMEEYKIFFNNSKYQLGKDFYSKLAECKDMESAFTVMSANFFSKIFHKLCIEYAIQDPQELTSQIKQFFSTDCIDELISNIPQSATTATGYIFSPTQISVFYWVVSEIKINYANGEYAINICFHFPDDYSLIEEDIGKQFNCLKENLLDKFIQRKLTLSKISYSKSSWDNIRVHQSERYGVICTEECILLLQGLPLIYVVPKGEKQIREKHCQLTKSRWTQGYDLLAEKLEYVNSLNKPVDSTPQKEILAQFYVKVLNQLIQQNHDDLNHNEKERMYQAFLKKKSDSLSFNDYVLLLYEMIQKLLLLLENENDAELKEILNVIGYCFARLEFGEKEKVKKITDILQNLFSNMDIFLTNQDDSSRFQVIRSFQELICEDKDDSIFAFTSNSFWRAFLNFFKITILQILYGDKRLEEIQKVQYKKYSYEESINLFGQEDVLNKADKYENPVKEPISYKKEVDSENTLTSKHLDNDTSVADPFEKLRLEFEGKLRDERVKLEKEMKAMEKEMKARDAKHEKEMKAMNAKHEKEMKAMDTKLNSLHMGKMQSYEATLNELSRKKTSLLSYYDHAVCRENLKLFKLIMEERFNLKQGTISDFFDGLAENQKKDFKDFEKNLNLQYFNNLEDFFRQFFQFYSECNQKIHTLNIREYKTVTYFISAFQKHFHIFKDHAYDKKEATKIFQALNGDQDSIDYSPLQKQYMNQGKWS